MLYVTVITLVSPFDDGAVFEIFFLKQELIGHTVK